MKVYMLKHYLNCLCDCSTDFCQGTDCEEDPVFFSTLELAQNRLKELTKGPGWRVNEFCMYARRYSDQCLMDTSSNPESIHYYSADESEDAYTTEVIRITEETVIEE